MDLGVPPVVWQVEAPTMLAVAAAVPGHAAPRLEAPTMLAAAAEAVPGHAAPRLAQRVGVPKTVASMMAEEPEPGELHLDQRATEPMMPVPCEKACHKSAEHLLPGEDGVAVPDCSAPESEIGLERVAVPDCRTPGTSTQLAVLGALLAIAAARNSRRH